MGRITERKAFKGINLLLILVFSLTQTFFSVPITSYAQNVLPLPPVGAFVNISQDFSPVILRGLITSPEQPLRFDFIVDTGDNNLEGPEFTEEATRMIKYFLASLTIPEDELWVNLSPYEGNRVIPEGLGVTEMGRDLLAQDYILKQLTASLIYPEEDLGSEFWQRVYARAKEVYGTTEIPINTFNKVWIIPDKAVVYEHNGSAFIGEKHLKVMLEEDFLALEENLGKKEIGIDRLSNNDAEVLNNVSSEIVREILLPEIEKEVNEGKNFAKLRQIFNAMILATWFKKNLKASLLGQVYMDKNKVKGVDVEDEKIKDKIYRQYLEAFKKGVYNYIKEDLDPVSQKRVPRKYFSGGVAAGVVRVDSLEVRLLTRLPVEAQERVVGPESDRGRIQRVKTDFAILTQKGSDSGPESGKSPANNLTEEKIRQSKEYLLIKESVKASLAMPVPSEGDLSIFEKSRLAAKQRLGDQFNEDLADHVVLLLKKDLSHFNEEQRKSAVEHLRHQAARFSHSIKGFSVNGYPDIDSSNDKKFIAQEEDLEDILFATMQGVDALGILKASDTLPELISLAKKTLLAHRQAVNLNKSFDLVKEARFRQANQEAEKRNVKATAQFEAVRRWLAMSNMLIKVIANLGLEAGPELKKEANLFLIEVMLDYDSEGEGFYRLREQAAYRLKNYETKETLEALEKATDPESPYGKPPKPSTVFMALNLEAANPNTLSIGLAAGMSLLQIKRHSARREIVENPGKFDFDQADYRFVRMLGVLDALVDPKVTSKQRQDILEKIIVGMSHTQTALAANVLLDALEEMILANSQGNQIFTTSEQISQIQGSNVRRSAIRAYVKLANRINNFFLMNKKPQMLKELRVKIAQLYHTDIVNQERIAEALTDVSRRIHALLGNQHRIENIDSFEEALNYLNIDRKIVIGSGGGASVSMSGVVARMTQDPALAVIGGTDNGGATLMVRSFEAITNGTFVGGEGDHVRFIYEAGVLEKAPAAHLKRQLLNHRFGAITDNLYDEINKLRKSLYDKAKQTGETKQFAEFFEEILDIARVVDELGLSARYNAVKNMVLEGIKYRTGGLTYDKEGRRAGFMSADGVMAALIEFARLVGSKSIAMLDTPFGNEIMVERLDGQEAIGQSFFSHTPTGFSRGRSRSTLQMQDISNYYESISTRSRIQETVTKAKLALVGLGSWGTSVGILMKNPAFVDAITKVPEAVLIANPVKDDETRGMSLMEQFDFLERMMNRRVNSVFQSVLVNNNSNLNRPILAARPALGNVEDVFNGVFGGYAGPNMLTEEHRGYLRNLGLRIFDDTDMATVELKPSRMDPDQYISVVVYNPEAFAGSLWSLINDAVKNQLTPTAIISFIQQKPALEALLSSVGLTWQSFGMESIHEIVFQPELQKELYLWLKEGKQPEWLINKKHDETWFQYSLRSAVAQVTGNNNLADKVKLSEEISIGEYEGLPIKIKILNPQETDTAFPIDRTEAIDEEARQGEVTNRLGRLSEFQEGEITGALVELPYEVIHCGLTPKERIERLQTILNFNLIKAKLWVKNLEPFQLAHQNAIEEIQVLGKNQRTILDELAIAIPYLRQLNRADRNGWEVYTSFDMDGTFTAAGTKMNSFMAYRALRFFRGPHFKAVMTAQGYEGPLSQIVEEVTSIERQLEWISKRTGIPRPTADGNIFKGVSIGVASGGALFTYDPKVRDFKLSHHAAMDPMTINLIKLVARLAMPEIKYEVSGYQIELREPKVDAKGKIEYAAMAVFPSGRADERRDYDINKNVRTRMGVHMELLLQNVEELLDQVNDFVSKKGDTIRRLVQAGADVATIERGVGKWTVKIGDQVQLTVLPEQYAGVVELHGQIQQALKGGQTLSRMSISMQPGGSTTLDISPAAKGTTLGNVIFRTAQAYGRKITATEKAKGSITIFLGDEIIKRKHEPTDGGKAIMARGNDYSVAEAQEAGLLPNLKSIIHVGDQKEGDRILGNTTTAFSPAGVVPKDVVNVLAYSAGEVTKGQAVEALNEKLSKDALLKTQVEKSLNAYGVAELSEVNEQTASEILADLKFRDMFGRPLGMRKHLQEAIRRLSEIDLENSVFIFDIDNTLLYKSSAVEELAKQLGLDAKKLKQHQLEFATRMIATILKIVPESFVSGNSLATQQERFGNPLLEEIKRQGNLESASNLSMYANGAATQQGHKTQEGEIEFTQDKEFNKGFGFEDDMVDSVVRFVNDLVGSGKLLTLL